MLQNDRTIRSVQFQAFSLTFFLDSLFVRIYADGGGMPGAMVFEELFLDPVIDAPFTLLNLTNCPNLPAGTYWLALQGKDCIGQGNMFWRSTDTNYGSVFYWRHPNDPQTGCLDWTPFTSCGFDPTWVLDSYLRSRLASPMYREFPPSANGVCCCLV